ncbi:histidine decarboxylase [Bradyrhizobium sp. 183]|uniref:histidine decarboxylase n=1 Tax=unclassified Bradyrhizobium TaxID=2631580 RepID=UPI00206971FB|nr:MULTISPECIES: histidine decarboxylase [unclassified Bradyrhizobium]UPJ79763.1 histidine decarboxylase [Bradyrhizobium sp. 184]UPJ87558.1 histidine decarboxylase [Bradyrhizobium sp. 183]
MLDLQHQRRIDDLFESMKEANECFLGYPFAKGFSYDSLWRFMEFTGNNLGDPFRQGTYRVSSSALECEVVEFFARLFRAPSSDSWGYVTNGGTEGNTYGLYLGRELYPNGIVYFSRDTHYSVSKAVRLLGLEHSVVASDPSGEISYEDLAQQASRAQQRPAIVVANIGTTMKEAKDDIQKIRQALHGARIRKVYLHSDAALCGPYAPLQNPATPFDFADGADSITVSGHKFLGAPMPCGVVIARKQHVQRVLRTIDYIGSSDTTLSGSRNAYTPIVLWYAIRSLGIEGIKCAFDRCERLAAYAVHELNTRGVDAWRNANALTVVFPPVEECIRTKWQIATQDVSHLVVMPGTCKEQIDALIAAMTSNRTASLQE